MSKKKLYALMALVIVLAILGTGTLAYFTTLAVVHNVVTTGGVNIELKEEFPGATAKPGTEDTMVKDGVMPGQTVTKEVYVENLEADAWIRIRVDVSMGGKSVDPKLLRIDYNTGTGKNQWTRGDGNIYYYNSIVSAGGKTTPLFTKVEFAGAEMGNEYQNAEFTVSVEAQAVQSENNPIPTGGNVTNIPGWPKF